MPKRPAYTTTSNSKKKPGSHKKAKRERPVDDTIDSPDETFIDQSKQQLAIAGGSMLGAMLGHNASSTFGLDKTMAIALGSGVLGSLVASNWDVVKNNGVVRGDASLLSVLKLGDYKDMLQYGLISGVTSYMLGSDSVEATLVSGWLGGASTFVTSSS
jgi:hypothetical protein